MTDTTDTAHARPADAPHGANPTEADAARAVEAAEATEAAEAAQPVKAAEAAQAVKAGEAATTGATSSPASSNDSAQPAEATTASRVDAPPQSAPDDALVAARAEAEWRVIGETVPGASHVRAGIPNQDAILHVRQSSARLPVIVSISDGHGSDKCFRSHRGSRFAVRIGADLLDELINSRYAALPPAEIESSVRAALTAEFIKRWRAAVELDLKREPLREEELARMVEKDGADARRLVEANPYLPYGATSLSFLLTPTYALYLQLGDGEIVTVSAQGEIGHPLPEDARLLANETTSLCLDKAADDFRFAVHPHGAGDLPALILMTTDGYYNSFATTAGFHQVGGDLLRMLREADGFGTVNRSVKGWLEEATMAGSGDDCTLAIICRMDALKAISSSNDTTSTHASPAATPSSAATSSSTATPSSTATRSSTATPSSSAASTAAPPRAASSPMPQSPNAAPDAPAAPSPVASHEQSATPKTA